MKRDNVRVSDASPQGRERGCFPWSLLLSLFMLLLLQLPLREDSLVDGRELCRRCGGEQQVTDGERQPGERLRETCLQVLLLLLLLLLLRWKLRASE